MFRDKRTIMRMVLIPLVAFPLIMNLIATLQKSQSEKAATKELEIGYVLNGNTDNLIQHLSADTSSHFSFIAYTDTAVLRSDVKDKSINLGLWLDTQFESNYANGEQGLYGLFYREADGEEYDRLEAAMAVQTKRLQQKRLAENNLPTNFSEPIRQAPGGGQSSTKEVIGKYAGGILPYIFMAFCFMGCMLPAIDLFAGEKERGTIETLLVTPVNRMSILVGKMIVVTAFGLLSATVALIGLVGSLYLMGGEGGFSADIAKIVTPQLVITLYLLLIPVAIFFSGIMIPISVYARSFKEAQSILTPLNIAVIVPTIVGFLPGIELNYTTACIPIVNVVMATKGIIAGNAEIGPLIITFGSLILLSAIAVFISFKQFGKEANVLR